MKIERFQIENYKSIKNSGPCYLSSEFTILAGKNECGKTAILEALRDFDVGVNDFDESSIVMGSENTYPKVTIWMKLDTEEIESINSKISAEIPTEILVVLNGTFAFSKVGSQTLDSAYYSSFDLYTAFDNYKTERIESVIGRIREIVTTLNDRLSGFSFSEIELPIKEQDDLKNYLIPVYEKLEARKNEIIEQIKVEHRVEESKEEQAVVLGGIDRLNAVSQEFPDLYLHRNIINLIGGMAPKMVYFSSFDDSLPYEIALADANNNLAVRDFCKGAQIDLVRLEGITGTQARANYLKGKSVQLTGDFKSYWKQDTIKLNARAEGSNLVISIEEEKIIEEYKCEQRSKGFQWFLTFYLRLMAEGNDKTQDATFNR